MLELEEGINIKEFRLLLMKVGFKEKDDLIDKLFWIFDSDNSGDIDFKELGLGLEILKRNSVVKKLERFFDLCDEDQSGTIDKKELYNMFKLNCVNHEDRLKLQTYVNEIFEEFDSSKMGYLTREELMRANSKNPLIKIMIESSESTIKNIDR